MGLISTALQRNALAVLRRNWAWAYFGESPATITQNIAALNGESILTLTYAATQPTPATVPTGALALIGTDGTSGNNVVLVNGATVPTGKTLTIAAGANFVNSGGVSITLTAITASGAITPTAANYVITKAGVAAMTLAAPATDGLVLFITSNTAFAHTITATGLLQTGSANVNVATFAAFAGASLQLVSYGGKWNVRDQIGITFS
jgi:hypothetical protein